MIRVDKKVTLSVFLVGGEHLDQILISSMLSRHFPQSMLEFHRSGEQALARLKQLNNSQYPTHLILSPQLIDMNGQHFLESYRQQKCCQNTTQIIWLDSLGEELPQPLSPQEQLISVNASLMLVQLKEILEN